MFKFIVFNSLCILFQVVNIKGAGTKIIKIQYGEVRGIRDEKMTSFLGIPYALPPLQNRRFRPPYPVPVWNSVLNATRYRHDCFNHKSQLDNTNMSEDCLYVNVFIPNSHSKSYVPVVVFLDKISGSQKIIKDKSQFSVANDVISVTFNSRQDILGFLSVDKGISGNFGLLDQVTVFRWVKNNIRYFGGDSNNINIVGDRDILTLHMSSPLNRVLFRAGIALDSMSLIDPLSVGYLRKHLNFQQACVGSINDKTKFHSCLRSVPVSNLKDISNAKEFPWQQSLFLPVIDQNFIKEVPNSVFSNGKQNFIDLMVIHSNTNNYLFTNTSCNERLFLDALDFIMVQMKMILPLIHWTLATFFQPDSVTGYFCQQIAKLFHEFQTSRLVTQIEEHSHTSMTFYLILNDTKTSMVEGDSESDIWCVFHGHSVEQCNRRKGTYSELQSVIINFIKHSYPLGENGVVWRPFTKSSKNHLLYNKGVLSEGNVFNWKYKRLEMFWNTLLPQLFTNYTQLKQGDRDKQSHQTFSLHKSRMGLDEEQLEALIFSLLLITLFLLCINMALFRIICYVRGKPFYKRKNTDRNQIEEKTEEKPSASCNGHIYNHDNNSVEMKSTKDGNLDEIRDLS